jgi:heme-degrading monooxygenase HmoA
MIYTLGIWTVRPGSEDDFVRAWEDMGRETKRLFPTAAGTLLRDHVQLNRFISFGPWESLEQVVAWRESSAFTEGLARIREVLDGFEPTTMDLVTRIE